MLFVPLVLSGSLSQREPQSYNALRGEERSIAGDKSNVGDFLSKVRKTAEYHARHAMVAARALSWSLTPRTLRKPVFIVGCSRAGTTVVYKTFSESRELGSLQKETHDFWISLHPLSE